MMDDNVCTDTLVVRHVTDALQAQERLSWVVGQQDSTFSDSVKDKCHDSLDHLRALKSTLEGSDAEFRSPIIDEDAMVELKQQVLMHVPRFLTDEGRAKIKTKVEELMKGECKSIVSMTLLTCPWYELSQKERGEQAKHNILLVIFTSFDEQFFSPTNPQVKEKASIIDYGWFQAVELSHFGQALSKGRSRFVEAVYCRTGAEVWSSDAWKDLQKSLPFNEVVGTRAFMEACLGQAMGGISKKVKNGDLKFREGSTVREVCDSMRLLSLAESCLQGDDAVKPEMEITDWLSTRGKECLKLVKTLYEHPDPQSCKKEIFDLGFIWTKELRAAYQSSGRPSSAKAAQSEVDVEVGNWLMRTRLNGREIQPFKGVEDSHSRLTSLMEKVGGPVTKMLPEQIVLIAVAGSKMYNLDTPTSDVDYTVVYMSDTRNVLSATGRPQESFESKGLDKMVEYGVQELRAFAESLLKCSVVSLELVYAYNHKYMSPVWEELVKERKRFVTEKAIQQYTGLIKNNFRFIDKGKRSDDPKRERKLFYKIFHKLHSLEDMMYGRIPEVRLEGDIRDFIMNVRTHEDGEWSKENILAKAVRAYKDTREELCRRTHRLTENTDYTFVMSWLMKARGVWD